MTAPHQVRSRGYGMNDDGEYRLQDPETLEVETPERPMLPLTEVERRMAERQIRRRAARRFSLAELIGTTTLLACLLGMLQWTPLWLASLLLGLFTLVASWMVTRQGVASRGAWITYVVMLLVYVWVAIRIVGGWDG